MKSSLRMILFGALAALLTAGPGHAGKVKRIKIQQGVYRAGTPVPKGPVIRVQSNDGEAYHSVAADNPLDFRVKAWAACNVFSADAYARVAIHGARKTLASGSGAETWKDLQDGKEVEVRTGWAAPAMPGSPVAACNDELTRRANQGTPRWKSLRQGFGIKVTNAYSAELEVRCGAILPDTETRTTGLDAWIHCLPTALAHPPSDSP